VNNAARTLPPDIARRITRPSPQSSPQKDLVASFSSNGLICRKMGSGGARTRWRNGRT
jgi:hypothetical protein